MSTINLQDKFWSVTQAAKQLGETRQWFTRSTMKKHDLKPDAVFGTVRLFCKQKIAKLKADRAKAKKQ